MKQILRTLLNPWVLFFCVVLIAALLRLPFLQYAEFKGDEALTLFLAARPLFHHPFPPAALTSSAGILNFPLINYLLFPIVIFTLYPPTISFVIALLNVLTIGGFFLLFSRYHGKIVGFLASILIAISPWMILYSRKIWEQDFLLPLSLPFFLSMYQILDGKKSYWLLFGISSMLLLQIHQLAIIVPLVIFICLLFKKQRPDWGKLLLGIAIGLLPTIPYFWYAFQTGFSNFAPTTSLAARFIFHDFSTFLRPLQILSIGEFHTEMGNDFAIFASQFHSIYLISKLSYLAYILVPFGAIFFWMKNKSYRFFVIVCAGTITAYFIFGIEPLMHYYILLVPLLAIIVAYSLMQLIQSKKIRLIGIGITLLYFISLILFDYAFLQFLHEKKGLAGDYGAGYAESAKGATTAMAKFQRYPNYQELYLSYFLPLQYFHGYMPIATMIFPYNTLKHEEATRESQLSKNPTNPLLTVQVFAYYTQKQNPSWDYITQLHIKRMRAGYLGFVDQQVLNEYLEFNLKRVYATPDFWLLYPRHWSSVEIPDGVSLTDGSVAIDIQRQLSPTNQSQLLGRNYYTFSSRVIKKNQEEEKYAQDVLKEVISSLRTLPNSQK